MKVKKTMEAGESVDLSDLMFKRRCKDGEVAVLELGTSKNKVVAVLEVKAASMRLRLLKGELRYEEDVVDGDNK